MRAVEPTPRHQALLREMKNAIVRAECQDMDALIILAIAAQYVGQLTALQDRRRLTAEDVMAVVANNIEIGNAQAVAGFPTQGSA